MTKQEFRSTVHSFIVQLKVDLPEGRAIAAQLSTYDPEAAKRVNAVMDSSAELLEYLANRVEL